MKAVIYARYSAGPRQTDQSIEGQLRVCHDYCKQKGLQVIGEYCDRHISGRTDERPEFQRLISDAKKKQFEAVVVYKTDRFARNKYDSAIYKRELRKAGVQIYYAAESIPDGPEGIILESLMEGLAEYYSAELSQKIKRGMNESALKCQSTGPGRPLGYKVDEQKHYIVDPETAPIVQTIFQMYIEGTPNVAICKYLNDRGFKTKQGGPFNKNSINHIIKNRKYIGEYKYNDIVIPGGMPAIVDQEVFAMAQAEMERRRTRKKAPTPKAEYLLAGKLFCGHCEASMIGVSGTSGSGKKFYYYYCPNNRGKKRECEKDPVPRDWLENFVADATIKYILQEDVLQEVSQKVFASQELQNDSCRELTLYNKKLNENAKAIQGILQAIESGIVTESLPARLKELEKERSVLEGELAFLKAARPEFTEDQILFMLMQYVDPKEGEDDQAWRKRIITCFVSEVYLWNDKIVIFFNITGPDGKLKSIDFDCSNSDSSSPPNRSQVEHRITILAYGVALSLKLPQKS